VSIGIHNLYGTQTWEYILFPKNRINANQLHTHICTDWVSPPLPRFGFPTSLGCLWLSLSEGITIVIRLNLVITHSRAAHLARTHGDLISGCPTRAFDADNTPWLGLPVPVLQWGYGLSVTLKQCRHLAKIIIDWSLLLTMCWEFPDGKVGAFS